MSFVARSHLSSPLLLLVALGRYATIPALKLSGSHLVNGSRLLAHFVGFAYKAGDKTVEVVHKGIGRAGIAVTLGRSEATVGRTIKALRSCRSVRVDLDAPRTFDDGEFKSLPGTLRIEVDYTQAARLQFPPELFNASPVAVRVYLLTQARPLTVAELADADGTTERTVRAGLDELADLGLIEERD